jgi:hypothetical protein
MKVAPIAFAIALPAALIGCGSDWPTDDQAGFIDLVPFFRASPTAADPTSSLPRNLPLSRGWTAGTRVESVDFGAVTVPRKLDGKGSALRIPDTARVYPMYFFFDSSARPMSSKPRYDSRTGVWQMRGGQSPAVPAPIDTPADEPARSSYFRLPNLLRPHDVLFDDDRGSSDFQRPIIDTLLDDANYTGLWEIVEVTVNDGGYQPDSIKSAASINSAASDGKLSLQRTGKVINCPVIDDRTAVTPSGMMNTIPRPRVEIWYRRMLGFCYLANGWETIGQAVDESQPVTDPANLRLFQAGVDIDKRVDTFDVLRTTLGSGLSQTMAIAVPVTRLFSPTLAVPLGNASGDITRVRYIGDDLALALPRHQASDPGGYSPIVWQWDLNVRQDPPYANGTYRDYAGVDPASTVARDADTNVLTRNYAIVGVATKCASDSDCRAGLYCNPMPDVNLATADPPPGQNLADVVIAREGGARCDVPVATFGGYCAPGVARCDVQAAAGGDNEKALKALGVVVAGPTFTIHADLATAQTNLSNNTMLALGIDPTMSGKTISVMDQMTAMAMLPALQATVDNLTGRVTYYDGLGFTTDLGGYGYLCYPFGGAGYCQIRCDSGASATNVTVKSQLPVVDGRDATVTNTVDYTYNTEARCGGPNMLGYRCFPTTVQPERQRVCLRECKLADTQNFNRALCDSPLNVKPDASGNPSTAFALGGGVPPRTAVTGQVCTSIVPPAVNGVSASAVVTCGWNPDFEPRDPNVWPGQ